MDTYDQERVEKSLQFAALRCRSIKELIDLACCVSDEDSRPAAYILHERKLQFTEVDRRHLDAILTETLSADSRRKLSPKHRPRADRLLSNVGECLSRETAERMCIDQLASHLKVRRLSATKLIRRRRLHEVLGEYLTLAITRYGDVNALQLATQAPGALRGLNCCSLIGLHPETPWGDPDSYAAGLVLARLWEDGDLDHKHAAGAHPVAYLRAMGRTRDTSRIELALQIVTATEDSEVLLMAASVFGRLMSLTGVNHVGERNRQLRAITYALTSGSGQNDAGSGDEQVNFIVTR
jgi:hypothetical protein